MFLFSEGLRGQRPGGAGIENAGVCLMQGQAWALRCKAPPSFQCLGAEALLSEDGTAHTHLLLTPFSCQLLTFLPGIPGFELCRGLQQRAVSAMLQGWYIPSILDGF